MGDIGSAQKWLCLGKDFSMGLVNNVILEDGMYVS